jgi:hypothetical protein
MRPLVAALLVVAATVPQARAGVGASTSTTTTTTATTLPASEDRLAGGLVLRTKEGNPARSKLRLGSIETLGDELTLGRGFGTADDPTLHGARLMVFSTGTGAFARDYVLDATTGTWQPKRQRGELVGYVFKSGSGPITHVSITNGRWLRVRGRGTGLGLQLGVDPLPVGVVLELGTHRYCFEFTVAVTFKANKRLAASKHPPPVACPTVPDGLS